MTLNLGAVVYFNHDLAGDPSPLEPVLRRLGSTPGLRAWSARAKSSTKPAPFTLEKVLASVRSTDTVMVGVETADRAVTLIASTGAPSNSLPRAWRHDMVLSFASTQVSKYGIDELIATLCDFAAAVSATAGVALWSPSLSYARALAFLSSGDDLTKEQAGRVADSYYWRSKWGEVIRGPEWGTFLSAAHVAKLEGRPLPAAKLTWLATGGAFVQATAQPFDVDAPPPELALLREALTPVMPHHDA